jgi:hypothetical protein
MKFGFYVVGTLVAIGYPLSISAAPIESFLQIDSRASSLEELESSHEIEVTTGRAGAVFTVDASAVVDVVPSRFEGLALDFDEQGRLRMPETVDSHTISHEGDVTIAWIHMSATGTDSKHYLEARVLHQGINPTQAWAASWKMIPGRPEWGYPDAPAFGQVEGALYVLPLDPSIGPDTRQPCYVRYYSMAEIRTALPIFLIAGFVKAHLAGDVQNGIRILEVQAQ